MIRCWRAWPDARLRAWRLFARGDVGEARERAPVALTRDAGEPLMDIPDDRKITVVAVAVERLHDDLAIADGGKHGTHARIVGYAPRIARGKDRIGVVGAMPKYSLDDRGGELVRQKPIEHKRHRVKRRNKSECDAAGGKQFVEVGPGALPVRNMLEYHARKSEIKGPTQVANA